MPSTNCHLESAGLDLLPPAQNENMRNAHALNANCVNHATVPLMRKYAERNLHFQQCMTTLKRQYDDKIEWDTISWIGKNKLPV